MACIQRFCIGIVISRSRTFTLLGKNLGVSPFIGQHLPSRSFRLTRRLCNDMPEEGSLTTRPDSIKSMRKILEQMDPDSLLKTIRTMDSRNLSCLVVEAVMKNLESFPTSILGELFEKLGKYLQASDSDLLQQFLDHCLERDDIDQAMIEIAGSLMFIRWVDQEKLFLRIVHKFGQRLVDLSDNELLVLGKSFIIQVKYRHLLLQNSTGFTESLLTEFARRIPDRPALFAVNALGAALPARPDRTFVDAVVQSVKNSLSSLNDHHFACLCRYLYQRNYKAESFRLVVTTELLSRFEVLTPWQVGYGLLLLPKETDVNDHLRKSLIGLLKSRPEDFQQATKTALEASRIAHGRLTFFFSKICSLLEVEADGLSAPQALTALIFALQAGCCSAALGSKLTKQFLAGEKIDSKAICEMAFYLGSLFASLNARECFEISDVVREFSHLKLHIDALDLSRVSQLCFGMKDLRMQHSEWCDMVSSYLLQDFEFFCDRRSREVMTVVSCFGVLGYQASSLFEKLGVALDSGLMNRLSFQQKVEALAVCALNNVFPPLALADLFTEVCSWSEEKHKPEKWVGQLLLQLSTLVSSRGEELLTVPELAWPMVSTFVEEARSSSLPCEVHTSLNQLEELLGKNVLCRRLITGRGHFVVAGFYLGADGWPVSWKWLHGAAKYSINQLHRSELQPVAVLAQPHSDFLFESSQPVGRLLLQERCLQACGWLTVVLPVHHLDAASDKHKFIEVALKNALC